MDVDYAAGHPRSLYGYIFDTFHFFDTIMSHCYHAFSCMTLIHADGGCHHLQKECAANSQGVSTLY